MLAVVVSQELYARDIVARYGSHLKDVSRRFDSPLSETERLSTDQCPSPGSPEAHQMEAIRPDYMSLVGALLWLCSCTRPDLTYAVSVLARFVSNPGLPHYRAAQRVLIYLSQTTARVLGLHPTADGLLAYSDADWASKFSTSGGLILYGGCPLVWYSRLQRSVVHSTAEAEYIAASMCCREAIFVYELLVDLGVTMLLPIPLRLDSKSAIDMAFDPVAFKKTKHILREAFYLRDLVAKGKVYPSHVASTLQRADIYTKPLNRVTFVAERNQLVQMSGSTTGDVLAHIHTGV